MQTKLLWTLWYLLNVFLLSMVGKIWDSFEIASRLKGKENKVRVVTLITRIYSELAREIYKFRERRR